MKMTLIDIFSLNLYQALAWTAITAIVASLYKVSGYKKGAEEILTLFVTHEKAAAQRVLKKIQSKNNEEEY